VKTTRPQALHCFDHRARLSSLLVDLSTYFNGVGITTNGPNVQGNIVGQSTQSLSANALASLVNWNSQAFVLGPPDADDEVKAVG
jgi:hypothetical protein